MHVGTFRFARHVGRRRLAAAQRVFMAFAFVAVAGCGGGDVPVDVAAAEAPAASPAVPAFAASDSAAGISTPAVAGSSATVLAPPLVIRRQPMAVEIGEGGVAYFSVGVEGPRVVTFQWLRDDEPIEGETGPILKLTATVDDHMARISVLVRAGRTTLRSDPALLRLRPV